MLALRSSFEVDKREEAVILESVGMLNALIGRALFWSPPVHPEAVSWPHAVALVAVNAKEAVRLPRQDEMVWLSSFLQRALTEILQRLLNLILDVFVDTVIDFHWIFEAIRAGDSTLAEQVGDIRFIVRAACNSNPFSCHSWRITGPAHSFAKSESSRRR